MPFSDPITAGNVLIRDAIQSPNYVPGVSGWTINKDGSAEFSDVTVRGTIVATSLRTSPGSAVDRIVIVPSVGENSIIFPAAGQSETDSRAAKIYGDSGDLGPTSSLYLAGGIYPGVLNNAFLLLNRNDDTGGSGVAHLQGVHGGVWIRALFGELRIYDSYAEFSDNAAARLPLFNHGDRIPDQGMFQVLSAACSAGAALNTALTDVTGASDTFTTVNANARILVAANGAFNITTGAAGALGVVQIVIDGVATADNGLFPAAAVGRGTAATFYTGVLPVAGSHTIKLQARKSAAGAVGTIDATNTKLVGVVLDMFN